MAQCQDNVTDLDVNQGMVLAVWFPLAGSPNECVRARCPKPEMILDVARTLSNKEANPLILFLSLFIISKKSNSRSILSTYVNVAKSLRHWL